MRSFTLKQMWPLGVENTVISERISTRACSNIS